MSNRHQLHVSGCGDCPFGDNGYGYPNGICRHPFTEEDPEAGEESQLLTSGTEPPDGCPLSEESCEVFMVRPR